MREKSGQIVCCCCCTPLIITTSVSVCVHLHSQFRLLIFFSSSFTSSFSFLLTDLDDLDTGAAAEGTGGGGRRQSALLEEIDFQLSGDYLLGAVAPAWHHCPLLFTFKNGFLALQSSQPQSV